MIQSAWKKLCIHFYPDTMSHHMQVSTELCEYKIKIANGESINLYATRLLRTANKLKEINKKFDDVYVTFQLLHFLPSKFDGIVQTILRWTDT